MRFRRPFVLLALLPWFSLASAVGQSGDFQPDPAAVQRYGPAYRYPQAGWIVLHIEGEPYERGYQHGRLLHAEIAAHIRCFAAVYSDEAPADAWKLLRMISEAMFLPRFDREYLEEMRGIADGSAAMGGKFDNRPLDLTDIVTLNLWPEIMTMPYAAQAVPTGLEGMKFPEPSVKDSLGEKPSKCSAFAATGPATADGKIIFGHITMFMLYPATMYNLWLDVQPANGHRVLMQSFPGGIHSGMDYYMNSAGILVAETTIDQTRLEIGGTPLSSRIRKALQYANSIDEVVDTLLTANNGLYTNEWLIADTKTDEIAMFELGTKTHKLFRSSKKEWFGGTEGFYWGCNNTKDLAVRLETIASTNDRPENVTWSPTDRDRSWIQLYRKHKGKMGVDFGREAFTTAPIVKSSSVDAKFTTTALAMDLKTWAIFGPPREKTWLPTDQEKRMYPEIEPLVANPWTILHGAPPTACETTREAVDLRKPGGDGPGRFGPEDRRRREPEEAIPSRVVWRGTLLPKTDGDLWLATAFADYHRIVEREKGYLAMAGADCLCANDLSKLAVNLYSARSRYLSGAAAFRDVPLSQTRSDHAADEWYRIASGKGVLVLSELRRRLGDERFVNLLDDFGVKHAGQHIAWTDFAAYAGQTAGQDLNGFFDYWVNKPGLPALQLVRAEARPRPGADADHPGYVVEGAIAAAGGPLPSNVEFTLETGDDEFTSTVDLDPETGAFSIDAAEPPQRLVVDKYSRVAKSNGGTFDVVRSLIEPERALIVYGTNDDQAANRETAELLQDRIQANRTNIMVPIASDREATDEQMRDRHLILVGRPTANRVTDRFRAALPVSFGTQSFVADKDLYADYRSAVIVAGSNPLNPRYSITAVAGLSAVATYRAAAHFTAWDSGAEAKILARHGKPKRLVFPAPELTHEFPDAERVSKLGTD